MNLIKLILKEVLPAIMLKNKKLDDIVNQYMETFYFLNIVMNNLKLLKHGVHLAVARVIENKNIYYLPYIFLSGTDIKETLDNLKECYNDYINNYDENKYSDENQVDIYSNLFVNIMTFGFETTKNSEILFAHSERAIELYLKSSYSFNRKNITLQIITALPICANCINFFQGKSYYIKRTNIGLQRMFCGKDQKGNEQYQSLDNLSSFTLYVVNPESNTQLLTPRKFSSINKLRGDL